MSQTVKKLKDKYPNKVPVILTTDQNSDLEGPFKYLITDNLTVSNVQFILRSRLNINQYQSIYLHVDNTMLCGSHTILSVYNKHKSSDGMLYIKYSTENTFG
jgi:GABA(A) receptor-associated protein